MNSLCCIYAYYEKDEKYKNNFKYFLENALVEEIDYYIVINGNYTVEIPKKDNIQIIERENIGFDFDAYSHAINNYIKKEYAYYIFLNTSVKGPYCENKDKWYMYFLELFKNVDTKLVGTTINIYTDKEYQSYNLEEIYKRKIFPHVQSMFFVMDNEYFNYLKKNNFFIELKLTNIHQVIAYKEFGLSQLALNKNWNINCILEKFRDIDYRTITRNINENKFGISDPYYVDCYFGKTIKEEDVIFFKNNRF